jgi:hypothetical protein
MLVRVEITSGQSSSRKYMLVLRGNKPKKTSDRVSALQAVHTSPKTVVRSLYMSQSDCSKLIDTITNRKENLEHHNVHYDVTSHGNDWNRPFPLHMLFESHSSCACVVEWKPEVKPPKVSLSRIHGVCVVRKKKAFNFRLNVRVAKELGWRCDVRDGTWTGRTKAIHGKDMILILDESHHTTTSDMVASLSMMHT